MAISITSTYDDSTGYVKLNATGFNNSVVRAAVTSKTDTDQVFSPVRGGKVAVASNAFVSPVSDFEFAPNVATTYKVTGYSSQDDSSVVESATYIRLDDLDQIWMKFVGSPYLNQKVILTGWGDVSRKSRNGIFQVTSRRDPVLVVDQHTTRSVTINLRSMSVQDTTALDLALSAGVSIFLHVPLTCALPTLYAAVGDYSYARPSQRSLISNFTIPLTEVAKPSLAITNSVKTFQTILTQNATYQVLLNNFPTYQAVLS